MAESEETSQDRNAAAESDRNDEESEEDYGESGSFESGKPVWHDEYAQKFPELFRDDVSIYPSYTNFELPYPVTCRQRYHAARVRYCRRLHLELLMMELAQQRAINGVRMRRVMSVGLRPGRKAFADPLNHNERRHLEDLLNRRKLFED